MTAEPTPLRERDIAPHVFVPMTPYRVLPACRVCWRREYDRRHIRVADTPTLDEAPVVEPVKP